MGRGGGSSSGMVRLLLARFGRRNRPFHLVKATGSTSPFDYPLHTEETGRGGCARSGMVVRRFHSDARGDKRMGLGVLRANPLCRSRNLVTDNGSESQTNTVLQNENESEKVDLYTTKFEVAHGDSKLLLRKIKKAEYDTKAELHTENLRIEYERDIRPLLMPWCLIQPNSLDSDITAFLHGQIHSIIKHKPVYLSCLDVMTHKKGLLKHELEYLVKYIIEERIIVVDDWSETYGDIQLMRYDSSPDGSDFYRGESDASFIENPDKTKNGVAMLSFIIWNGKEVVWSEVFEGVECPTINVAEIYAALALQFKCLELGMVKKLKYYTDSAVVYGVISGKHSIGMCDSHRKVYLLLRLLKEKFEVLIPFMQPRELLFMPDALLRKNTSRGKMVEDILKKFSPHLKGAPLFRIFQNSKATKVIGTFGEKADAYKHKVQTTFYIGVDKDQKAERLWDLLRCLKPYRFQLVIDNFADQPVQFQNKILDMLPGPGSPPPIVDGTYSTFLGGRCCTEHGTEGMGEERAGDIGEDGKRTGGERVLLVVFDASIPRDVYYQEEACTVILAEPHEVKMMQENEVMEVSTTTFVYFHGVEHIPKGKEKGEEREKGKEKRKEEKGEEKSKKGKESRKGVRGQAHRK